MSALGLYAALVITGATVHTADGPPRLGTSILIDGGRIQAVGAFALPPGAQVIDATGLIITPGFIESETQLGLVEIDMVNETRDFDAEGQAPVRAAFRVTTAFNPHSAVIPIQRAHGITTAVALPVGGLVAGQAMAFDLGADAPFQPSAALVIQLGAQSQGSRAQRLDDLRVLFADARLYRKNKAAFERNQYRALAAHRLDLEALWPVIDGVLPVVVAVHRAADIRAVLDFAAEQRIRIVLAGATEAWLEASRIAEAQVPVIVDPMATLPDSFDRLQVRDDLATRLAAAGVSVIISTFSTHRARTLRQSAGNAVRAGLDPALALQAITANPAKAFGFSDRGRVAVGQVANLVVWSGDPFEPASHAVHVVVAGALVSLAHRQHALFERYRTLP